MISIYIARKGKTLLQGSCMPLAHPDSQFLSMHTLLAPVLVLQLTRIPGFCFFYLYCSRSTTRQMNAPFCFLVDFVDGSFNQKRPTSNPFDVQIVLAGDACELPFKEVVGVRLTYIK